ncbi:MAG: xanthine dehydrogenase small subunit [Xanthobacteraceae bacterium]|nr:xanthine dehydrogenase small subunit [Xanthobacteraceae bacterium]
MRNEIRFLRGGREVRLSGFSPTLTLLDYLRLHERALGTKEGCAEGDCGACTVVLRRCVDGHVTYAPVNSCILFAGQADGAEVIAVDDLANGGLHPVQQAMVESHGSQCGFCTPGFVMALFGLYHAPRKGPLTRAAVNDFIAGNLCRCTGYRPIVDAALAACTAPPQDRFAEDEPEAVRRLAALADDADVLVGDDRRFFAAPASIASLADIYASHPDAVLVSGATDVGLWITKQLRDLPKIIWLGRVRGLDAISDEPDAVTFGATVTHQAAMPHLAAIDPDLGALLRRFAGRQVRTVGTIGGNIANGSPIGDTPPALIALGSTLILQQGDTTRTLPLEDFFIAYGRQDRRPGEFVRAVRVAKLGPDDCFRCYKISKRFDSDISAVMGAFRFTRNGDHIAAARIAFGGMAATPRRAAGAEAALAGVRLSDPTTWSAALTAVDADFSPLDDQRGSARYRRDTARALLRKALIEAAGTPTRETRVVDIREDAVVGR